MSARAMDGSESTFKIDNDFVHVTVLEDDNRALAIVADYEPLPPVDPEDSPFCRNNNNDVNTPASHNYGMIFINGAWMDHDTTSSY